LSHRSEVDDINLGLEHFYGDFNVVHARLISSGVRFIQDFLIRSYLNSNRKTPCHLSVKIKDYASLIDQISLVLRSGGLIDIMEFDFHVYDQNHKRIELSTHMVERPWWPRWLAFAYLAAKRHGGDVNAATHLHSWIVDHPAFEDVVYRDFWVPASPWIEGNDAERRRGESMRDDISVCLRLSFQWRNDIRLLTICDRPS